MWWKVGVKISFVVKKLFVFVLKKTCSQESCCGKSFGKKAVVNKVVVKSCSGRENSGYGKKRFLEKNRCG